ncbi:MULTISPECIES: YqjF family protein [Bacillaceae]|jgi:uncharacterized protein YqjF (DUF2071 family)|uniref:YqjF family protein n=1 Tax=Bacillaceae TaxID=186817 RepID=UPI00101D1408|nr:DUF2071 domain-containing protein [Ectobacillus funiculus]
MKQRWSNLLFCHYRVPVESLRPWVPAPLEIETCEGSAWIGIVSFDMSFGIIRYPQVNVRTYVSHKGKSGVYFLSCDAANHLAVFFAKRFYSLPYTYSNIQAQFDATVSFHSMRKDHKYQVEYTPFGEWFHAKSGSLEYFLTERYSLFTDQSYCDIMHESWKLQHVNASIQSNTLGSSKGFSFPLEADHLLYGNQTEVRILSKGVFVY